MVSIFRKMDMSNPDEYATKLAYDAMSRLQGRGISKQVVWADLIGKADQIIKEVNDSDYMLSPSESAKVRSKFFATVGIERSHIVKLYGNKEKKEHKADVVAFDTSSAESAIAQINEGLSFNPDGSGNYEFYEPKKGINIRPLKKMETNIRWEKIIAKIKWPPATYNDSPFILFKPK